MASSSTPTPTTQGTGQVDKKARNPRDFKTTENSRPDWNSSTSFTWTKTKNPNWKLGQGAVFSNNDNPPSSTQPPQQIPIDPFAPNRNPAFNYRLITSAIVPRPIALLSTLSPSGSTSNLAPYSYFQAMSHDPPTFIIGHAVNPSSNKDSLKNILSTKECVINILTEDILEAGNASALDTPYGISEWPLTGLTPASCSLVAPSRILEAVFAVECKLVGTHEIQSREHEGKISNVMTILEGVKFWVREDVVDEDLKYIDPAKSRPIGRCQGITYARVMEAFQIPWPIWEDVREEAEREGLVRGKAVGQ